jgi:hypothetical protein
MAKLWTSDEDAILIDLRGKGWSLDAIARKLGRTRNSVVGRGDRLKVAGPTMLEGRKAQRDAAAVVIDERVAECMAEHGGTLHEIAALSGLTWMQVRTSFRRIKNGLGWQAI